MSRLRMWNAMAGLLVVAGLMVVFGAALSVAADEEPLTGRIRVAHLAPFAMDPDTAVTIVLNGDVFQTNFAYGDSTAYVEVPAGEYDVAIFVGDSDEAAITSTVMVDGGKDYSVAAIGDGTNQTLELLVLEDDNTAPAAGQFHLRLGHLAPVCFG